MSGRRLIQGTDAVAHLTIGDTPYSRTFADDIHPSLELRGVDPARSGSRLAIPDRTLTPAGSSVPPDPQLATLYDAGTGADPAVLAPQSTTHIALGAHAPDGRGLQQAVRDARVTGIAQVHRASFTSDIQLSHVALALVAAGVAVISPTSRAMDDFLHPQLIEAIPDDPERLLRDPLVAESISAHQRRLAWLHHDLMAEAPLGVLRLQPRRLPPVSVLLATNRPEFVEPCLERIARQSHPDLEVVVAMHGSDSANAAELLRRMRLEGCAIEVDGEAPLGHVLNAAARRASGLVVTKWDDDDLYSEDHLIDMCVGLRYSGAEMVGKAPEFILFEEDGHTALRNHTGYEQPSTVISGGTMTMSRMVFDDLGGFPPIPRAVDHYMKRALIEAGGTVYRMHGFGFVLVRHDHGHTWQPPAGELESGVHRTWVGVPPIAGVIESCS